MLFQSVTSRTAGFNTVEIGPLTNGTILLLIVLMSLGASPGSTGGGVKTTERSLAGLARLESLQGKRAGSAYRRTIPSDALTRTVSMVFASRVFVALAWSLRLISGGGTLAPRETRPLFAAYLFETVSAFGTVGLSMGGDTQAR